MAKVVVIGYGNTIRGDDAFGVVVAERLLDVVDEGDVKIFARHTLTPELAAEISGAELAVFVDAAETGAVGQLQEDWISADPDCSVAMVHFLDPGGLLNWSMSVYEKAPKAVVLSVRGEQFGFDDMTLTGKVEKAVGETIARIEGLCGEYEAHFVPIPTSRDQKQNVAPDSEGESGVDCA